MGAFQDGFNWVIGAIAALVVVFGLIAIAPKAWSFLGHVGGWLAMAWHWSLASGMFGVPRIIFMVGFVIFLPFVWSWTNPRRSNY